MTTALGDLAGISITLNPNAPIQVPVGSDGITIINQGGTAITLGTDDKFSNPTIPLAGGASLPWSPTKRGSVCYAVSTVAGSITVMSGLFNYYNPNVQNTVQAPQSIFNQSYPLQSQLSFFVTAFTNTTVLDVLLIGIPFAIIKQLKVVGVQSGAVYTADSTGGALGIPPDIISAGNVAIWRVNVDPALDSQYAIAPSWQGGGSYPIQAEVFSSNALQSSRIVSTPANPINEVSQGGLQKSTFNALGNGASFTLLAAPASGLCYRLHSYYSSCNTASPYGSTWLSNLPDTEFYGAVNAVVTTIALNGLLVPNGVQVNNLCGIATSGTLTYDIVATPNII